MIIFQKTLFAPTFKWHLWNISVPGTLLSILTSHSVLTIDLSTRARARADAKLLQLYPTLCEPWAVACQAPLTMGFSRQKYWSVFPCPPARDPPHPEIEPVSPALIGGFLTVSATWEASYRHDQLFLNLQPLSPLWRLIGWDSKIPSL